MRKFFIESLEKLDTDLIELGAMCEKSIDNINNALINKDADIAKEVMASAPEFTIVSRKVETDALTLVLRQQPVAGDFRKLQATMKIIADLNRISAMCADFCELLLYMCEYDYKIEKSLVDIANETKSMLSNAVECYIKMDLDLCEQTIRQDDKVDALFAQVKEKLEKEMSKNQKIHNVILDKLMIAKYYERIADHAENIAHWVKYVVTGLYKGEQL
ncbi:MAG: phosphate signaling complex protein PhoU [Eubacteriales bacterium]|nr:phosphate signaling complex protein PhoU [Eubacteriales bacterium]